MVIKVKWMVLLPAVTMISKTPLLIERLRRLRRETPAVVKDLEDTIRVVDGESAEERNTGSSTGSQDLNNTSTIDGEETEKHWNLHQF